jgi:tRNA1Val (adenine37-N6)-methyltransferase
MKVTTDACIQGAWTPLPSGVANVLDIGTGTGLLSLMLAQKKAGTNIDAVEIDKDAAEQARQNVVNSPWADRINVINADITNWRPDKKYDLIITNPPFFNNSLLTPHPQKNVAKHTITLDLDTLFHVFDIMLVDEGIASVLLPVKEFSLLESIIKESTFKIIKHLTIKHTVSGKETRKIGLISRGNNKKTAEAEFLIIKDSNNEYTPEFSELMNPYYLNL